MMLADRLRALLDAAADASVPHDGDDSWAEQSGAERSGAERSGAALIAAPVEAAVLVAFIDRARPTILLTMRPGHMTKHAGQAAFPGGRRDATDADLIATALREAEEEVGLPPASVTVIGPFAPYRTVTGYRVTPVLAVIPADLPLVANPHEVARIFELRADHLFDPAHHQRMTTDWEGRRRGYWQIEGDGERVWGATAGMLVNIGAALGLSADPALLNRVTT